MAGGKANTKGRGNAMCPVLPAYKKFHTTLSCDAISCVTSAVDTLEVQ
jgi:hypothetical protein